MMLLRPRQKELVDKAIKALNRHGNTLAVAPTGAGKTVMLSAVIGEMAKVHPLKTCVVAHRDELTAQNRAKFGQVNPHLSTSVFNATFKSWHGDTTFAMAQTLCRERNLETMPPLDLMVIDEAHHAVSDSYRHILDHAKTVNPCLKVLGLTATPNRGDKKGLRPVFSNVCDRITVRELIASGHLVRPRMFVIDVGTQADLDQVEKTAGDYDMEAVAKIMDTRPIIQAVIKQWREKAEDRQTVVFCATLEHADHVCQGFQDKGILAALVHGEMDKDDRKDTLQAYREGKIQVIVNVAVLLEGWDDPLTSCVVLLRPSSYKSTFIQMVGRGLRPLDPEKHPGILKTDCIVLDFGTATLAHGSIEEIANLDGSHQEGDAPTKACPQCGGEVPLAVKECPLCGCAFDAHESKRPPSLSLFAMKEVDILARSHFLWVDVNDQHHTFMAAGFEAWSGVFFQEQWRAVGGVAQQRPKLLAAGDKGVCFAAADDWMNLHETNASAHKVKTWVGLPATSKQLGYLPEYRNDQTLTRYKASALLKLKFNAKAISATLEGAAP